MEAELLSLAVKGRRVDAKDARRFVEIMSEREDAAEVLGLERVEGHAGTNRHRRVGCDPKLLGQIGKLDGVAGGEDHGAFHHIAQLAQVARPAISTEGGDDRRRITGDFLPQPRRKMAAITLGEFEQIARTLAQTGQGDGDHVETIEKIFAETPGLHLLGEIAVGRSDHAHLGAARCRLPHPLVFALLQEAEQLGLDGDRQFADFVEEQGTTRGGGDLAHVSLIAPVNEPFT